MEDNELNALVDLPMPRKELVLRINSICSKQIKNVVSYLLSFKQAAPCLEELDELDLSRIEFPQRDKHGSFRQS